MRQRKLHISLMKRLVIFKLPRIYLPHQPKLWCLKKKLIKKQTALRWLSNYLFPLLYADFVVFKTSLDFSQSWHTRTARNLKKTNVIKFWQSSWNRHKIIITVLYQKKRKKKKKKTQNKLKLKLPNILFLPCFFIPTTPQRKK